MSKQTTIELNLLLPKGNGCEPCRERLQRRIQSYRGIEVAHLDEKGDSPRFCIHYDPSLLGVDYVRALAIEEGAHLEWRYHHEILPVLGLDCADCARTLEGGIGRLAGVLWVSANFAASTLAIEYDTDKVSRPAILSRVRALGYDVEEPAHKDGLTKVSSELAFRVDGLDCADCALHLEEALRNTPGIAEVSVDFTLARLRLTPQDGSEVRATVAQVAESMGYSVMDDRAEEPEAEAPGWREWLWRRRRDLTTVASGLLIALAVGMRLLGLPEPVVAVTYVLAIFVGGFYIARSGWAALRTAHSLDMNALMTIAAVGAVFVGEWAEGAVAMFLFSLGNTLEGYTMDRARNAIRGLMDLSPRRATVVHGNSEMQVPVEDLQVGDRILVRPGERIPMDGLILAGESSVNQAPITGESVPVDKAPGQEVYAGTVNGQGALTVRVTRLAADTTIARIIKMVEEAQAQKAPSQRFVDRFARVYTPLVIVIAAGVAFLPPLVGWMSGAGTFGALFGEWVYRALVLLVIACPCALVISTPVTIVSAIASAARAGVLIKGGAHLESLGSLKVIAFDKTGTLTAGKPQVVDVRCLHHVDGLVWADCDDCRQMVADAAAVERQSEHPLARAVVGAAEALGLASDLAVAEAVEAMTGRGIRGQVNGHALTVGTHTYIHESNPDLVDGPLCDAVHAAQAAGQTAMVVRDDCCGVRGYIAVADTLRPGVGAVMVALQEVGIEHTIMLTGDNEATAQAIAQTAGVEEFQADLLPEQKVVAIEGLLDQYGAVAMVGDGVNDAPALARATVGIAMGAAGTDTALETADVALMADDLGKLPFAVTLSQQARRIIRQNVALSLGIKAVFLALAIGGVATLWMAVFADMGASLIVTVNGMRLLRRR
ncbi:MAG TPA: heavy metal translocating P-type ATPase [Anaerolineae bacterium]|nr:heavy metal translocating P-type ATPase [Anaerolineae bacterium]